MSLLFVACGGACGGATANESVSVVLPPASDAPPAVALASAGGPITKLDACAAAAKDGVAREGQTEVWITRELIGDGFTNGGAIGSARIVPVVGPDGGLGALRLEAVKTGGFLDRIGFVDGDEIETVNGTSITDAVMALQAYTGFANSKLITVGMTRGAAHVELVIHVCD